MIAMLPEEFAVEGPPVIQKCSTVSKYIYPTHLKKIKKIKKSQLLSKIYSDFLEGADACDAAFLFNKCIYTEKPEVKKIIFVHCCNWTFECLIHRASQAVISFPIYTKEEENINHHFFCFVFFRNSS